MKTVQTSSSSSLTDSERAVAVEFADAECDRMHPRCREAYHRTVLARRTAEIIADRALVAELQRMFVVQAEAKLVDDALPVEQPADPATFRPTWRTEAAAERQARFELLAKMVAEQSTDTRW